MPYQDDFPQRLSSAPLNGGFNDVPSLYLPDRRGSESESLPSAGSWMTDFNNDFSQNAFRSPTSRGRAELSPLFRKMPLDPLLRGKSPPPRQRTAQACDKCRERKTKCSGHRPICSRCTARGLTCKYSTREGRVRGPSRSRSRARREEISHSEFAGDIMPTPAYRSRVGGGRTNAFVPSTHNPSRLQTELAQNISQSESPDLLESPLPRGRPVSYIARRIYPASSLTAPLLMGAGLPSSVLDAPLQLDSPSYILPGGHESHQLSYPASSTTHGGYTLPMTLHLPSSVGQQSEFEAPSSQSLPNYWPSMPPNPLAIPDLLFPALDEARSHARNSGGRAANDLGEGRYPSPFSSDNSNPSSSPCAAELETPLIPAEVDAFTDKPFDFEAGVSQGAFDLSLFASLPRISGEQPFESKNTQRGGFSLR